MSAAGEPDTCNRWIRDFVVAHVLFASGFFMAPVAVLLLQHRSAGAIFFATFAAFYTSVCLLLCLRFYAELRRPPWPRRRRSAAPTAARSSGAAGAVAGHETEHSLRDPAAPRSAEVRAALAAGRVPTYAHLGDGDGVAGDCAVCLGELEKGETVRRLRACQHVFHLECIDLWLRAHATCPVCRSGVLPEAPERTVDVVVIRV
ncbi:unnamed protein product [Urochloa decumbens]|uniref:RING-type domain-containing protein n=1 Tax=Urochloa decumbens TaxID=240449 RepID=A0ABC8ZYJ0_9POAL